MKIMINHIKNTYNYGSAMMAVNLIHYLDKSLAEKVEYSVDSEGTDNLNRILYYTKYEKIQCDNEQLFKNRKIPHNKILSKIYKIVLFKNEINSYINYISKKYDANIILGGDDLSEYYSQLDLIKELIRIRALSKHIPVFLVGQTIGPFTSFRKKLASYCLKNCNIYTRDSLTYKYLTEELKLNSSNIIESSDLAFLELPKVHINNETNMLNKYKLPSNKYITVVPSGLASQYTSNQEDYITAWINIINNLLADKELIDYKIVILPHVLKPTIADDRVVIKELSTQLKDDRIVFVYDELLPHEAREILGKGLFTISGRMHASVSTLQMKKPAISLSYSIKYKGVIGEALGLNELVIECSGDDAWKSSYIADEVKNKVKYILNNYQVLQKKINESVYNCEELALKQIQHLANKLG